MDRVTLEKAIKTIQNAADGDGFACCVILKSGRVLRGDLHPYLPSEDYLLIDVTHSYIIGSALKDKSLHVIEVQEISALGEDLQ